MSTVCDAVVVELSGGDAWVELPARVGSCGNCSRNAACSGSLVGNAGVRRYRLANTIGAQVGDRVQLNVGDGTVWTATLASYVLPLLLALAGAVVGQAGAGDAGALAGTLMGLGAGLWMLRRRELRARRENELISLKFPLREARFEVRT